MRLFTWIASLAALLAALTACAVESARPVDALPLADDRPTFIFFFTDN